MEFLLNISIHFTADQDEATRAQLITQERAAADVLKRQGKLIRMWRVPCRIENWGLWRARDATELNEIIAALPLFPWMRIVVHPLGKHPVDPPGADEWIPSGSHPS